MQVWRVMAFGATLLLTCIRVSGEQPPASYSRGVAALAYRELEDAEKWLRRALEEAPAFWRAYRDLGECLLRDERPGEAVGILEQALELRPQDERTQSLLAEARSQRSAKVEARAEVAQAAPAEAAAPTPTPRPPLGDFASRPRPEGPSRTYVITGRPLEEDASRAAEEGREPVSASMLDWMRKRAEAIYRPRMTRVALDVRRVRDARRQYLDACLGTTREVIAGRSRGYGESVGEVYDDRYSRRRPVATFTSQTEWVEDWDAVKVSQNSETPTCLRIASDFEAALQRIESEMSGVVLELKAPPSVYRGVANEVYAWSTPR